MAKKLTSQQCSIRTQINTDFSQEKLPLLLRVTSEEAAQEAQELRALKKLVRDLELQLAARRISAEMDANPTKVINLTEIEKRLGLHER